jgi:UDP-2-acetamido-3-amino-2,3-dideoxy-glucuronate N-acetyltransferase
MPGMIARAGEGRVAAGAQLADGALVHESAYVDDGAVIGAGTRVWHFCHVNPRATIGARCSLGQNVVVMPGVVIGDNVKIQNNVSVYEGVELEDDVFCGPSMVFTNVYNPRSAVSRKNEYRRTLVKRGASIGANATIVCGATIGRYAFIGAGAVVNRDVPDYALMAGVPAKRIGWMSEHGERLEVVGADAHDASVELLRCPATGHLYERRGDVVSPRANG